MEVQMEVSRVWGQALARIAAAEVYNFRFETEPRVRGGKVTPAEALATIQRALAELLPLADPLIVGIHRRWVDHELTQYAVREAEEYAPGAIPGAIDVCLLFCDLKDFTTFAELSRGRGGDRSREPFCARDRSTSAASTDASSRASATARCSSTRMRPRPSRRGAGSAQR